MEVRINEPMKRHTTFRAGGNADWFVVPESAEELAAVLNLCRQTGAEWYLLGNGSNLLVSDRGFHGVIIGMERFSNIEISGNILRAGAGVLLSRAANEAYKAGLTGFEFAAGIPGTLGGAVVMNAGAYGSEMKNVLAEAKVLDQDGALQTLSKEDLKLGYRTSCIPAKGYTVLEAVLELSPGKPEEIRKRMDELAAKRKEKQPLEFASAGSTFKRPEGYFAGKLIEDAGLKGYTVGGAQVSEKHAGFVINRGDATAEDIYRLCCDVKDRVKARTGVSLEMEVKLLGNFGKRGTQEET